MDLNGIAQELTLSDGVKSPVRLGRQGDNIVSQLHGQYYEQGFRGNLFHAVTGNNAGVDPGTTLSTSPSFVLFNPLGSGVNLVIEEIGLVYVSGTLGTAYTGISIATGITSVTGSKRVPQSAFLTGRGSLAQQFDAPTLAAAPTLLRPAFYVPPMLATDKLNPGVTQDMVNGSIIIPQGCIMALSNIGLAGTTPRVMYYALFEEVPA